MLCSARRIVHSQMRTNPSMRSRLWISAILALLTSKALAFDVRICTDRGAIDVDIDEQRAPLHAANFQRYMESGFYAGTVIHRAVAGSMVQGGSFDRTLERRAAGVPVANESGNGLSNVRGTIAASRGTDPNSATSQFFFNLTDNSHLDGSPGTPGYTVFGRVTAGLDVLDRISALPTRRVGELEVPQPLVEIRSIARIEPVSPFRAAPAPGLGSGPEEAGQTALRSEFLAAMSRNDAPGILAAADAFRQNCLELEPAQQIAEAEAAISLGYPDRARYLLDDYLSEAGPRDPALPRARSLYAALGGQQAPEQIRDIDSLVRSCSRPAAPTIPGGRFAEPSTLAALEDAVRRYRDLGRQYLGCVEQRITSGDLSAGETVALTRLHNDVVAEVTAVSMRYNQFVRAFRESRGPAPISDQGR
jgi:peptidyl-prolyl cis-trans isomerase A (cyclophilin A)